MNNQKDSDFPEYNHPNGWWEIACTISNLSGSGFTLSSPRVIPFSSRIPDDTDYHHELFVNWTGPNEHPTMLSWEQLTMFLLFIYYAEGGE